MKIEDIISGGTIDQEGIRNLKKIIDQNKKIKDSYAFRESWCMNTYYSKHEAIKEYVRVMRQLDGLIVLVRGRKKVKSKEILDYLFNK